MRRKVAFGIAAAATVLLTVFRLNILPGWHQWHIGPIDADYLMIFLVAAVTATLFFLCRSKEETVRQPHGRWRPAAGWACTFFGAVLTLCVVADVYVWVRYGQVPPPNDAILHAPDLITLIGTLIFGLAGGVCLMWQGYCWMTADRRSSRARAWLALAPVLWMWFRLARYEVSYASTVDIGENFFEFALMIFGLIFLFCFARAVSRIGPPPRTALLTFALLTAMTAISGLPANIIAVGNGQPLGALMITIVDGTMGIFAAVMATMQVFAPPEPENDGRDGSLSDPDDPDASDLAWRETPVFQPPVDPAFDPSALLPDLDIPPATPKTDEQNPNAGRTQDAGENREAERNPARENPDISKNRNNPPSETASTYSGSSSENTQEKREPRPQEPSADASAKEFSIDDLLGEIDEIVQAEPFGS